jgi:predicted PhzF superfamily epimerase YddE/YHI9
MDVEQDATLLAALGLKAEQVVSYAQFDSKGFIEVDSEQTVLELEPNFDALKNIQGHGSRYLPSGLFHHRTFQRKPCWSLPLTRTVTRGMDVLYR